MFDYLTKISSINLKKFILKSINHLDWESNLSIIPLRFSKCFLEVSMNISQWERFSWKTAYSMILINNAKWVSSQLFGCSRVTVGPLEMWHLYHLMFVTELLLVGPVGHIDPHMKDWVSKCLETATYQLECDALTYRAIRVTLYCVW